MEEGNSIPTQKVEVQKRSSKRMQTREISGEIQTTVSPAYYSDGTANRIISTECFVCSLSCNHLGFFFNQFFSKLI